MPRAPRLFCLDTVLVDVVVRVAAFPPRGGDVRARDRLITTGGGFNAMSAAARHHMAVTYAGRLGEGPFGALAASALEGDDIAVPVQRNVELDSGICIVIVEPDGERSFVTAAGAESTLRSSDLAGLDVNDIDYVLVSGYNVMYPVYAELVMEWLYRLPQGTAVLFDPATRARDIPSANLKAMLARTTWLLCNAREAAELTGESNVIDAVHALVASNDHLNVLVRRGSEGCVVVRRGESAREVGGFATRVLDTNGAGDVHNGVFAAELASGHDPIAAARWANAAAAMAISRLGPATCPTREEVALFIDASSTETN